MLTIVHPVVDVTSVVCGLTSTPSGRQRCPMWLGLLAAPFGEGFHSRRLTLRSSQVGAVATAQRGRWSHRRRLVLALELLADPVYDRLVTGECRFADLPAIMAQLATSPAGALCQVVRYP